MKRREEEARTAQEFFDSMHGGEEVKRSDSLNDISVGGDKDNDLDELNFSVTEEVPEKPEFKESWTQTPNLPPPKNDHQNKEEEYFKMSLLSYQLFYKNNQKIMTLDYKALYKDVAVQQKLPFYQWNNWLKTKIERLNFEYMYQKKTEFQYAKFLSKKYEVKENHF